MILSLQRLRIWSCPPSATLPTVNTENIGQSNTLHMHSLHWGATLAPLYATTRLTKHFWRVGVEQTNKTEVSSAGSLLFRKTPKRSWVMQCICGGSCSGSDVDFFSKKRIVLMTGVAGVRERTSLVTTGIIATGTFKKMCNCLSSTHLSAPAVWGRKATHWDSATLNKLLCCVHYSFHLP